MVSLNALMAFAETARRGSFAAAARELGLTASAIAKSISRLEHDFGLRLFNRTTRHVSLTADGEEVFAQCNRILEEVDRLSERAAEVRLEPTGIVRVSCTVALGKQILLPLFAELGKQYPLLKFEVNLTDRFVDLVEEHQDAAVRVGELNDSALVARQIGSMSLVCVASPQYLEQNGTPSSSEDARQHRWIAFKLPRSGRTRPIVFAEKDGLRTFSPNWAMILDVGEAIAVAARAGTGLAQVPWHMVKDLLASGALSEVLADLKPPPTPVYFVCMKSRRLPPRLAVILEALKDYGQVEA